MSVHFVAVLFLVARNRRKSSDRPTAASVDGVLKNFCLLKVSKNCFKMKIFIVSLVVLVFCFLQPGLSGKELCLHGFSMTVQLITLLLWAWCKLELNGEGIWELHVLLAWVLISALLNWWREPPRCKFGIIFFWVALKIITKTSRDQKVMVQM